MGSGVSKRQANSTSRTLIKAADGDESKLSGENAEVSPRKIAVVSGSGVDDEHRTSEGNIPDKVDDIDNGLNGKDDNEDDDYQNYNESPRSPRDTANADMFAATAMSLGLENDDLLFNLLYFAGNENVHLANMFNSAMEETVALYSENNTPYKLRPASEDILESLETKILSHIEISQMNEPDCAVCKDDMEAGNEVIRLPLCHHIFHRECIIRWFMMVRSDNNCNIN